MKLRTPSMDARVLERGTAHVLAVRRRGSPSSPAGLDRGAMRKLGCLSFGMIVLALATKVIPLFPHPRRASLTHPPYAFNLDTQREAESQCIQLCRTAETADDLHVDPGTLASLCQLRTSVSDPMFAMQLLAPVIYHLSVTVQRSTSCAQLNATVPHFDQALNSTHHVLRIFSRSEAEFNHTKSLLAEHHSRLKAEVDSANQSLSEYMDRIIPWVPVALHRQAQVLAQECDALSAVVVQLENASDKVARAYKRIRQVAQVVHSSRARVVAEQLGEAECRLESLSTSHSLLGLLEETA